MQSRISSNFCCCVGSLVEAYDEWGTRYSIPVYCLSNPLNLLTNSDRDSPAEFSEPCCPASATTNTGEELKVKGIFILRISN